MKRSRLLNIFVTESYKFEKKQYLVVLVALAQSHQLLDQVFIVQDLRRSDGRSEPKLESRKVAEKRLI